MTNIPEWAIRAADDYHGAQEVDRDLALLIAGCSTPAILDLSKADREIVITNLIHRESMP